MAQSLTNYEFSIFFVCNCYLKKSASVSNLVKSTFASVILVFYFEVIQAILGFLKTVKITLLSSMHIKYTLIAHRPPINTNKTRENTNKP